jgi:putative phosphoesterase
MKIAIISDIHGNFTALKEVYADIKAQKAGQIYALGDLVGYYPQINEVVDFVIDKNIISIMGNYDKACLCDNPKEGLLYLKQNISEEKKKIFYWTQTNINENIKSFLSGLPQKIELIFENKKVLLVHGSPSGISNYLHPDSSKYYLESMLKDNMADILICGHTHIPMTIETKEGFVLNPGSVGASKDGNPAAAYLLLDIGKTPTYTIRRVPFDKNLADALAQKKIYSTFGSE